MNAVNEQAVKKNRNLYAPGAGKAEAGFRGRLKERAVSLLLMAVMVVGICLLAYPSVSDYWNSFHQSGAVLSYAETVANMNAEEYARILADARAYNAGITEKGINWVITEPERAAYIEQLNMDGLGVMGYIKIQKIDLMLPIYHGTEETILRHSIGHLEQTSLPVGGKGTHCMLSGHRGLPSAKLFSDLDKMREGDTFTITVLNETLTYEVDHVWIVEPKDVSHLIIEPGKDLCTLITCTPYGVNTHRLLVRGHRIDNLDGDAMVTADALQIRPVFIAPFISIPILLILLIYVLVSTSAKKIRRKDYKEEYMKEYHLREEEIELDDEDVVILDALRRFSGKRFSKKV